MSGKKLTHGLQKLFRHDAADGLGQNAAGTQQHKNQSHQEETAQDPDAQGENGVFPGKGSQIWYGRSDGFRIGNHCIGERILAFFGPVFVTVICLEIKQIFRFIFLRRILDLFFGAFFPW